MPVSVTCPLGGSSRSPQSMAGERDFQDAKYADGNCDGQKLQHTIACWICSTPISIILTGALHVTHKIETRATLVSGHRANSGTS